MATDIDHESAFDPRRRLCPDGNCIGIVGSDGKCTVCGTSDLGGPGPVQHDSQSIGPAPEDKIASTESTLPGEDSDFDPNRRLCSDESCIGVVGDDDRCKLCGKPAVP